jgi:aryl-alcohol dehydrogenase-like predicted oxidoreductase
VTLAGLWAAQEMPGQRLRYQRVKVRASGASNFSAARLREALELSAQHGLPRYEGLQPPYNLYDRAEFEAELEPLCLQENLGVIPYFALAKGFLTGKYRAADDLGKSVRGGGVKQYLNERGERILAALDEVAAQHQATPGRVALAWLIARPSMTAPIASATSLAQLEDLIAATRLRLSEAALAQLAQASA